jgi:hypothetical protein
MLPEWAIPSKYGMLEECPTAAKQEIQLRKFRPCKTIAAERIRCDMHSTDFGPSNRSWARLEFGPCLQQMKHMRAFYCPNRRSPTGTQLR